MPGRGFRALTMLVALTATGCSTGSRRPVTPARAPFPPELVDWVPYEGNPLFAGTGQDTWDREIRERGFILREGDAWRLWFTGYDSSKSEVKALGYATSPDGIRWTRHPGNPVFDRLWTEDVFVLKHEGVYQMFAEGKGDVAHRLTSTDGLRWEDQGSLDVRTRSGAPLPPGPTARRRSGSRAGPSTSSTSATTRASGWPRRKTSGCGRTCGTSR